MGAAGTDKEAAETPIAVKPVIAALRIPIESTRFMTMPFGLLADTDKAFNQCSLYVKYHARHECRTTHTLSDIHPGLAEGAAYGEIGSPVKPPQRFGRDVAAERANVARGASGCGSCRTPCTRRACTAHIAERAFYSSWALTKSTSIWTPCQRLQFTQSVATPLPVSRITHDASSRARHSC